MRIEKIRINSKENVCMIGYYSGEYVSDYEERKRPIVLICPGGGFFTLSEREGEPVALEFICNGFQAFVLYYSISDGTHGAAKEAYSDLLDAITYIKKHSATLGGDADRIILVGFSAGAYLAAMYQSRWMETDREGIKGVILGYPACDLSVLEEIRKKEENDAAMSELRRKINISMDGTESLSEEQKRVLSPVSYVNEGSLPAFIWATCDDELIPVVSSLCLAQKLNKYKIPYELHIYQGGVHGLSLARKETAEKPEEVNEHCAVWFQTALRWIENRLFQVDKI